MRRSSPALAAAFVAGWLLLVALPEHAAGASAPPSASQPPADPSIQIWQDEPLPPDIAAGRTIEVGFTTWDTVRKRLSELNTTDVRVHPAKGKGQPTKSSTRSDWPGHLVASITIPIGGLGRIDIGYPSQACRDDGTCVPIFQAYAWGGIGPPADAPRSLLVVASILPPREAVVVGQQVPVQIDLAPRAGWDPALLALPDRVVAIASDTHGDGLSATDLRPTNGGPFIGSIAFPEAGDATLVAALPGSNGQPDDVIESSRIRVKVASADEGAAAASSSRPAASSSSGSTANVPLAPADGVPLVPIAIGVAVVLAAAFVASRVLADL